MTSGLVDVGGMMAAPSLVGKVAPQGEAARPVRVARLRRGPGADAQQDHPVLVLDEAAQTGPSSRASKQGA